VLVCGQLAAGQIQVSLLKGPIFVVIGQKASDATEEQDARALCIA
jgi:hypothetical protein